MKTQFQNYFEKRITKNKTWQLVKKQRQKNNYKFFYQQISFQRSLIYCKY